MAYTVAALKACLGSTDYFILAMKAKELVDKSVIPSEMPEWDEMTLEERVQRDINYTRVKNQIAPYLAQDKDRFFGAIIVAAKNFDPESFETIGKISKSSVPNLYQTEARSMGFLTFTGGETLIPLDGQHRLKAIKFAIEGKDEKSKEIEGLKPSLDLANEDVTVILVPYDKDKSRKIFTKVNRYAKATTKGQNLVTDDDDFFAVSSRHIANKLIGGNLVQYDKSTLADKDPYFTTLAIIAECNDAILKEIFGPIKGDKPLKEAEEKLYLSEVENVWEYLLNNITEFSDMLVDKTADGNKQRQEIRRDNLLGKPIPQWCLVKAYVRMINSNSFTEKNACAKLNQVDWSKKASLWQGVLVGYDGKKILYKNKNVASDLIYYICGGKMGDEEVGKLKSDYGDLFPAGTKIDLPPKV